MMCCLSELTNSSVAVLPWPDVHRRFDFNSITWIGGRSIEVKKKFYKRIADEMHERTGVRKEDVWWINLVDDAGEGWSFGNGEMQYAPK
jgi:hypothetical protein